MQLLRPLGIDLPLIAERGYHLEFPEAGIRVNNSVQDAAAKVFISGYEQWCSYRRHR